MGKNNRAAIKERKRKPPTRLIYTDGDGDYWLRTQRGGRLYLDRDSFENLRKYGKVIIIHVKSQP